MLPGLWLPDHVHRGVYRGAIRLDQVILSPSQMLGQKNGEQRVIPRQTDRLVSAPAARALPATPDLALSSWDTVADPFWPWSAASIRLWSMFESSS